MPQQIERHGHTVTDEWLIDFDDRPITWDRLEAIAGRRMDRRKKYAVIDGEVCCAVSFTTRCSGCTNGHEERGFGCDECGYHGVVRQSQWVPESVIPQEI